MTVIDLGAVRAARAAELQLATTAVDQMGVELTELAERYAAMAFAISEPFRLETERLAVDLNRAVWRRMRANVRKALRKHASETREHFGRIVDRAFATKLVALIRENDQRLGLPRRHEVIGALWVTGHKRQPMSNSWPTSGTLGRLGTLAWMSHIETTPYVMKPGTRSVFDAARKSLQDNPVAILWGDEARVVNRIIRTCWARGWRPEEARSA